MSRKKETPINYHKDHYTALMEGKVRQENMENIVTENLAMMDTLLENRKVSVFEIEATKSAETLIAYINQSEYVHRIIGYLAHLSTNERLDFIKGMNVVHPYVANREKFISHIKLLRMSTLVFQRIQSNKKPLGCKHPEAF